MAVCLYVCLFVVPSARILFYFFVRIYVFVFWLRLVRAVSVLCLCVK